MTRPPRVFISRTTSGLQSLAQKAGDLLRERGIEVIIEEGFYPSTHDIRGMLVDHLQQCDAVICLIGSAYGTGPHDPITKAEQPIHGLKDPRTKDRLFSYSQLELLIARDLGRPIYTFIIEGNELPTAFPPEPPELAQRQQTFITEFAKDTRNTYGTFSQWDQPADPARGLKQVIETIKFEVTLLAGKPANLPYTSLGTLFKGRDEFLLDIRQHLTAEGPVVIKGKRAIHGMGGVGKTRAAIEYAWKHANDYNALLFISADTPESLQRNLAALCGPLILNLPEQHEKEQALQVEAALRWLHLHTRWLLIIDNVDTTEAAEETKALLAKLTTGHVLITSRISDWTGHIKSMDLDVLNEAASIDFLNERTEERRPKKDDDPEKVTSLVKLLDCLALALEQAGAHISTSAISYADYIALWETHRPDALAWHDEETMKYPKSLAITYETSVAQLSDGAKDLFRVLSWFAPDPIPRNLLDSKSDPKRENRYLGEIERLHLSRYLGDGKTFSIHRLNQEITRQQQAPDHTISLVAALEWLNGVMPDDTFDSQTWHVVRPILSHAITAGDFGVERTIPIPSNRLLSQSGTFLMTTGQLAQAERLFRSASKVTEEHVDAHDPLVATYLSSLALVLMDTNRHSEAEECLQRAIKINDLKLPSDHDDVARDLNNLAMLYCYTGKLTEAEPLILRVLNIQENSSTLDSKKNYSSTLNNYARILQDTGRLDKAEEIMRRAVEVDKSRLDKSEPLLAIRFNNLARIQIDRGFFAEAEMLSRQALAIDVAAFGTDHPRVAFRMVTLARALRAMNRLSESEQLLRDHLEILLRISSSVGHNHRTLKSGVNAYHSLLSELRSSDEADRMIEELFAKHGLSAT